MQEMQEMQVQSLGREDPLEEETATYSSILAWRIPWTEEPVGYGAWGLKESDKTERLSTHCFFFPVSFTVVKFLYFLQEKTKQNKTTTTTKKNPIIWNALGLI